MSWQGGVIHSIQVIILLFSQLFGLRTAISIGLPVIADASGLDKFSLQLFSAVFQSPLNCYKRNVQMFRDSTRTPTLD
jgi:hypothetical protein